MLRAARNKARTWEDNRVPDKVYAFWKSFELRAHTIWQALQDPHRAKENEVDQAFLAADDAASEDEPDAISIDHGLINRLDQQQRDQEVLRRFQGLTGN